jgi:hypothetical protein
MTGSITRIMGINQFCKTVSKGAMKRATKSVVQTACVVQE